MSQDQDASIKATANKKPNQETKAAAGAAAKRATTFTTLDSLRADDSSTYRLDKAGLPDMADEVDELRELRGHSSADPDAWRQGYP